MLSPNPAPIDETILAREANHRIANHLAQIAAKVERQIRDVQSPNGNVHQFDAMPILRSVIADIMILGDHHRRLAGMAVDSMVELGDFLMQTWTAAISLLSLERRISVAYRLEGPCNARAETAHLLGLVLNEIVMNAAKHACPAGGPVQVTISCARAGDKIRIEVADNGIGLPDRFDPSRDGGIGFQIIRALSKNAGAELSICSDNLGLSFHFMLPVGG
jgi:two-component sensor histidine kinase